MFRMILVALLLLGAQGMQAQACITFPTVAAIDNAFAEARGRLSPQQIAAVQDARRVLTEAVAKKDYVGAKTAEADAMDLMGWEFEARGTPMRGCQSGEWVRKGR